MRPASLGLIVYSVQLVACAGVVPLRLPDNPGWIGGQRVSVSGPLSIGVGGPELAAEYLKGDVENDLTNAGFVIADGGLRLVIESFERNLVRASVRKEGAVVDRFEIGGDQLGCLSSLWGLQAAANAGCYSNGIAAAVMRSQAVAQAAGPPTQAVASQKAEQSARPPPTPVAPSQRGVLPLKGKLAVLDLRNFTRDLTQQNAQYFTDVIRQASLRMEPGLDIMTRENLLVLLQSTGKKLEECEGECEVDTGRRIGADQIVSGEIQKVGTKYKLTLRLHDTHQGKLLSSAIGSGKSIDELDESAQKTAEELFTLR